MNDTYFTAFAGTTRLVTAPLSEMLRTVKGFLDGEGSQRLLIFDDSRGEQVDFDFSGNLDEVLARVIGKEQKRAPGRPRLGVVGREISLLPRHWEWLDRQPQSASATIRRLIDTARKDNPGANEERRRIEAADRFIWVMAGDLSNFEEASRALYSRNWERLQELTRGWPVDVRDHLLHLLKGLASQ